MESLKLKMTASARGSTDGVLVSEFKKGKTYDIPDDLANVFLAEKLAIEVKVRPKPETPEK